MQTEEIEETCVRNLESPSSFKHQLGKGGSTGRYLYVRHSEKIFPQRMHLCFLAQELFGEPPSSSLLEGAFNGLHFP